MFTNSTKYIMFVTLVCFTSMRLNAQIPLKQNATSLIEL